MTIYFTASVDMPAVARQINSERAYDELFNELAEHFDTRGSVLAALEQHCLDLDNGGKNFLFTIADFVDSQFPGER